MSKAKQLKAITMLFTAYGQGGEAERIAMYVEMLKDIPAEVLEKVCRKAILECKYLPSIAEILQAARNFMGEETLPFADAWDEIETQMKEAFVYEKPKFSRKEIEKTVNAFGWQELCEVTTKELPVVRAQLRDMYLAICEQSKKSKVNNYVMGNEKLIGGGEHWKMLRKADY